MIGLSNTMRVVQLMSSSLIIQKLSIALCMLSYSLSLVHMVYMVLYYFGLKSFSLLVNIVYSLIVRSLTTVLSSVAFSKVQFVAQYYLLYMLMTYHSSLKNASRLSCLRKMLRFTMKLNLYWIAYVSKSHLIQFLIGLISGSLLLTFQNVQPIILKNNPQFAYRVKGAPILSENTVTDLGVIVSKDLTYHEHINKIVAK